MKYIAIILSAMILLACVAILVKMTVDTEKLGDADFATAKKVELIFKGNTSDIRSINTIAINPGWRRNSGREMSKEEIRNFFYEFQGQWTPVDLGETCSNSGVNSRTEFNITFNGIIMRCVFLKNQACCRILIWSRDAEWVVSRYKKIGER